MPPNELFGDKMPNRMCNIILSVLYDILCYIIVRSVGHRPGVIGYYVIL